jgi:diguanylate cyclase (GGDEF)-like protein
LNRRLDAARKAAERIAQTDALTGLQNRRAMTQYVDQLITGRVPFACMHMDLDYFKSINDTFGHAAGDYVLRAVAQVLNTETRAEDCVARIGGDEFVLIFVRVTDRVFLQRIAQRMIARLEEPVQFDQHVCCISASAGTSISIDYPNLDPDVMLSDANRALYASKKAGCGQHRFAKDHQRKLSQH